MTQTNWQVLKTGEAAHAPLPVSVPELLVPAGDLERLRLAVLYGADAVYLAGTTFGMRAFAGNFTETEMKEAVRFAHAHGVRVHVTVNTMPRNDEVARLPDYLATLEAYGVDALIVADVGVLALARQYAPHVPKQRRPPFPQAGSHPHSCPPDSCRTAPSSGSICPPRSHRRFRGSPP